jgi:hypothetical protein
VLGWHISAYRFADEELRRARGGLPSLMALLASRTGSEGSVGPLDEKLRLAVWQTWLGGTDWLDALIDAGEAAATSRNCYPNTYVILFRELESRLARGLLGPDQHWRSAAGDRFLPGYLGRDTAFEQVLEATEPLEWIVVRAWDES